jgi:hypothetical protein
VLVLNAVVGLLPARLQPYAKAVMPTIMAIVGALVDWLPGCVRRVERAGGGPLGILVPNRKAPAPSRDRHTRSRQRDARRGSRYTAPSASCTPGAHEQLTHAEVCASKARPSLSAADRRAILHRYGLTSWSGSDGELDHRVPLFMGGMTDARNVWPQRGPIPNPKDRLENYVRGRVCFRRPYPMTLRSAYAVFAGNWISALRLYRLDAK